MTNMINTVDKADRYTYLFQGNSQVLDHILVSNHLADSTKTDILHINADLQIWLEEQVTMILY